MTVAEQRLYQPLLPKLLLFSIHCLGHTIRKEHQPVAGPQLNLTLLIAALLEGAEDQSTFFQPQLCAILTEENGRIVSGVAIKQRAAEAVDQCVEEGNKLPASSGTSPG